MNDPQPASNGKNHEHRRVRGAVIGAGYFSQFHYDAWARMDDVEIVACCDLDIEKCRAVADRYQIPAVYTDYTNMIEQCSVDFVDVITRPDTHLDVCRHVAACGIDMICQKPLAPSFDEARELIDSAAESGVRLMVHENFRFQPWYRKVKQLYEAGEIGGKLHTVSFRNRAGDGWGDDAYLARQPYFRQMERFLIYEAGIHTVDTFRFLAGEVKRVWCSIRRLNPVIAGEDAAMAVFEFASGAMGLYDANRYNESTAKNPRYTFGEFSLEADGGTIRLDGDGNLSIQPLGDAASAVPYDHRSIGFGGDCVLATQQHFINGLHGGAPFETDGRSYLRSLAVQEAMYRSAESGQWEVPSTE